MEIALGGSGVAGFGRLIPGLPDEMESLDGTGTKPDDSFSEVLLPGVISIGYCPGIGAPDTADD